MTTHVVKTVAVWAVDSNTEHGASMAATVLNSPRAVQMSVFVVRDDD